ncbi:MAG: hypothetical protein JRG82_03645 [Deltaproteobacteria bacterium]|nr:hypothetical protein [Deltaproteobacteria bacterium]
MRVGIWLVVVAAVAGLFVLLLHPSAHADDLGQTADILLDRAPLSADERQAEAEEILSNERERKGRHLAGVVLDEGVRLVSSVDPRRVARATWRVVRTVWKWSERSDDEDAALDQLEIGVAHSDADPELLDLYTRLRRRELDQRIDDLLLSAESAFEDGHVVLARARVQRSLELAPERERVHDLIALLSGPLPAARAGGVNLWEPGPELDAVPVPIGPQWVVDEWEAPLATAMLSRDYARAAELAPTQPRGELARAAAHYLDGDRQTARRLLTLLRDREDPIGWQARDWSARPEIAAADRFESEVRRYHVRRALGLLGGAGLASNGLYYRSRRGYDAWRRSLAPLNLVLSFPARLARGWRPDGRALRAAAHAYLEYEPEGEDAEDATSWLAQLGPAQPLHAGRSPWRGSRLVLPRARTRWERLSPGPIVLTRSALESGLAGEAGLLQQVMGDAEAVLLRPERDAVPVPTLDARASLDLLAEVTRSVEAGDLEPLRQGGSRALERLQRLETGVRSGLRLVVVPLQASDDSMVSAVSDAMLDGGTRTAEGVRIRRGADDLRLDRSLGGPGFVCPEAVLCVHRPAAVTAGVYGAVATDADMLLGASASFQRATLALELRSSGPHARLTVPIARWLGFERWVPVAARVEIGTEGVYVGPVTTRASR